MNFCGSANAGQKADGPRARYFGHTAAIKSARQPFTAGRMKFDLLCSVAHAFGRFMDGYKNYRRHWVASFARLSLRGRAFPHTGEVVDSIPTAPTSNTLFWSRCGGITVW